MSVNDPIADMLTRIRNANRVGHEEVVIPASRLKVGLAKILREEGFIKHYKVNRVRSKHDKARGDQQKGQPLEQRSELRVFLKYGPRQEKVIQGLRRISRPGLRRYVGAGDVPLIQGGLGMVVLSTSKGLLTGRQARQQNVGGELLCAIW